MLSFQCECISACTFGRSEDCLRTHRSTIESVHSSNRIPLRLVGNIKRCTCCETGCVYWYSGSNTVIWYWYWCKWCPIHVNLMWVYCQYVNDHFLHNLFLNVYNILLLLLEICTHTCPHIVMSYFCFISQ